MPAVPEGLCKCWLPRLLVQHREGYILEQYSPCQTHRRRVNVGEKTGNINDGGKICIFETACWWRKGSIRDFLSMSSGDLDVQIQKLRTWIEIFHLSQQVVLLILCGVAVKTSFPTVMALMLLLEKGAVLLFTQVDALVTSDNVPGNSSLGMPLLAKANKVSWNVC